MRDKPAKLPTWLGRLLCQVGFHDYRLIEVTGSFGTGGHVQKVEGLGLSHMDLELTTADGRPNGDWVLEEGMVVPLHLLYPGGERERIWLEEIVVVTPHGGRPLFSWGFEPMMGS